MGKKIDLTGRKFGRWTVIKEAGKSKSGDLKWKCDCDCGNVRVVSSINLRRGLSKSCGCFKKERAKETSTTHGMVQTLIYKVWNAMIQRCSNPKSPNFKYYGGRGIKVCQEWLKFESFFEDMGERPEGLTLERINNNGNYEPSNCKWATAEEQSRNRRIQKNNKTGVPGVFWYAKRQKYQVAIKANCKQIHIGYFASLQAAKIAREKAEQKYWHDRDWY